MKTPIVELTVRIMKYGVVLKKKLNTKAISSKNPKLIKYLQSNY